MSFEYSSINEFSQVLGPQLDASETCQNTRVVLKFHNKKNELTVRATDDNVCLKYRTNQPEEGITGDFFCSIMSKMAGLSEADIVLQKEQMQQVQNVSKGQSNKKKKGKKK